MSFCNIETPAETILVSRKVFVQLSEADAVKLKAQGFSIIFR